MVSSLLIACVFFLCFQKIICYRYKTTPDHVGNHAVNGILLHERNGNFQMYSFDSDQPRNCRLMLTSVPLLDLTVQDMWQKTSYLSTDFL